MYSDEYVRRLKDIYSELDTLIYDTKREIKKIEEVNGEATILDKERCKAVLLLSQKAIEPLYHLLAVEN